MALNQVIFEENFSVETAFTPPPQTQKSHTAGDSLGEFRIRKVPQSLVVSMDPSGCWDWLNHSSSNKSQRHPGKAFFLPRF